MPKPLPEAITAGHFGQNDGKPVNPTLAEVRAITENHAEKIIDLLDGIAAKHFGEDDQGKPIKPSADEVRAITESHAERLIDRLDTLRELDRWLAAPGWADRARLESERARSRAQLKEAVDLYAGRFGGESAERLEAYAKRQLVVKAAEEIRGRN